MDSQGPASHPDPIADDLTCAQCGYNLRGLARDGACPEYAAPCAWSREMAADESQWRLTIARGAMTIVIAIGVLLLEGFVGYVLFTSGLIHAWTNRVIVTVAAWFLFLIHLAAYVAALLAVVWLTEPRPQRPSPISRRLARIALLVGGIGLFVLPYVHNAVIQAQHRFWLDGNGWAYPLYKALEFGDAFLYVTIGVGTAAMLNWIGALAVGFRRLDLAREIRYCARGFVGWVVALPLVWIGYTLPMPGLNRPFFHPERDADVVDFLALVLVVALIGLAAWALVIVWRFGRSLARTLEPRVVVAS